MTAILTAPIPQQNFEKVRDRIGSILLEELIEQASIQSLPELAVPVFAERFISFNANEYPAFTVSLDSVPYDSAHPNTRTGTHTYNLDFYSSGKSTTTEDGDKASTLFLHKILGMAMYIFSAPLYIRLGFAAPFIQGSHIKNMSIEQPIVQQDLKNSIFGRVTLEVRFNESSEEIIPVDAEGYTTSVSVNETDKGYQYIVNN